MRKFLSTALAATLAAAAIGASSTPAMARGHHDNDVGIGIGAGVAGFALGATLAHPYHGYYYGPGYDEYGPDTCVATRRVWDPYYDHYVWRRYYYDC
jgi:hypothetical protein